MQPLSGSESAANIAAIVAGELAALAADAHTLATRLAPGDVVAAVVLPSNGLTDLLAIGGLRVAAELPPTLLPGEQIAVMVTGFTGDRINLQIVPAAGSDANVPAAAADTFEERALASMAGGLPRVAGARGVPSSVPAMEGARPEGGDPFAEASHEALGGTASRIAIPQPLPHVLETIEARLAAAHAMPAPAARPHGAPAAIFRPGAGSVGRIASPVTQRPPIPTRPAAPPPIATRPAASPPLAAPVTPVARDLTAFREPAVLLRALGLPVSAPNVAAAQAALEAPDKLPATLATLERALASSNDPPLRTLATLTAFLTRLAPDSPVLATQIAAFADHAVFGPEAKLAQLAHLAPGAAATVAQASPGAPAAPAAPAGDESGAPAAPAHDAVAGSIATERAAILRAGLDYDLKTQLLAFVAGRSSASPPGSATLDRAVAGALTAITGLQLNAAAALAANPDGIAFTLPVALPDGFVQARVRIDREAPEGRKLPLDGDNFHLAFVLETRHLGTVGIDVTTVGRAVTLGLKTEGASARRVFGAALGELTARLETLRYRVAKADAVVAPIAAALQPPSHPPVADAPSRDPDDGDEARLVDIDA